MSVKIVYFRDCNTNLGNEIGISCGLNRRTITYAFSQTKKIGKMMLVT